jgi:hypothetical protein
MAAPASFDLIGQYALTRGFPWHLPLTRLQSARPRRPVDLTGMRARFEVYDTLRQRHRPWVFSTDSGHLTLGDEAGTVDIRLAAEDTARITATACRYRLIFLDSWGRGAVLLRGRLAVLEHDR